MSFWLHDSYLMHHARHFSWLQRGMVSGGICLIIICAWLIIWQLPLETEIADTNARIYKMQQEEMLLTKSNALLQKNKESPSKRLVLQDTQQRLKLLLSLMTAHHLACESLAPHHKTTAKQVAHEAYMITAQGNFHHMMAFFDALQKKSWAPFFQTFTCKHSKEEQVSLQGVIIFSTPHQKKSFL